MIHLLLIVPANNVNPYWDDVGVGVTHRGGAVWTVLDFGGC